MSSAISGSLNLSRAQSQIPIDETGAASNIQNFSTYDAVELIGYVFASKTSALDSRASVKLSIVKNGAGSYEVAASDIAGDDYSGSPIVSFSMSGSLLQATLDSALVAAESPSESYIRYALSAPAVGGPDNISIDSSKLIGTIDSGVLPKSTAADDTEQYLVPEYREATVVLSDAGPSDMNGTIYLTKIGNVVTALFVSISHTSGSAVYVEDIIPAAFRPNTSTRVSTLTDGGGGTTSTRMGEIQVYGTGRIQYLYRNYSGVLVAQTSPSYDAVLSWISN